MALQLTETNMGKALFEFSKLFPGDEVVVAQSTNKIELEAYLTELNRRGLDVYHNRSAELQYKFMPGQANGVRLVIFKRGIPTQGVIRN